MRTPVPTAVDAPSDASPPPTRAPAVRRVTGARRVRSSERDDHHPGMTLRIANDDEDADEPTPTYATFDRDARMQLGLPRDADRSQHATRARR